jgi:hypothetical protein
VRVEIGEMVGVEEVHAGGRLLAPDRVPRHTRLVGVA